MKKFKFFVEAKYTTKKLSDLREYRLSVSIFEHDLEGEETPESPYISGIFREENPILDRRDNFKIVVAEDFKAAITALEQHVNAYTTKEEEFRLGSKVSYYNLRDRNEDYVLDYTVIRVTMQGVCKVEPLPMIPVMGGTFDFGYTQNGYPDYNLSFEKKAVKNLIVMSKPVTAALVAEVLNLDPSLYTAASVCSTHLVQSPNYFIRSNFEALAEFSKLQYALRFIELLNIQTGRNYRLPTHEEWQYIARGGYHRSETLFAGSNDLDETGLHAGSPGVHDSVRQERLNLLKSNELGLYFFCGFNQLVTIDPKGPVLDARQKYACAGGTRDSRIGQNTVFSRHADTTITGFTIRLVEDVE